jgi:hypothetical protein
MLWAYFTGASRTSIATILLNNLVKPLAKKYDAPAAAMSVYYKVMAIVQALAAHGHVTWAMVSSLFYNVANTIMIFFPEAKIWSIASIIWDTLNAL